MDTEFAKHCIGCGEVPPIVGEDTTLLSRRGWRLTRGNDKDGKIILDWRCPRCWARYRALKTALGK